MRDVQWVNENGRQEIANALAQLPVDKTIFGPRGLLRES